MKDETTKTIENIVRLRAGETLIQKGETVECVWLFKYGLVSVQEGDEILTTLEANGSYREDNDIIFLNEIEAVLGQPSPVTIKAHTFCLLIKLSIDEFWTMIYKIPEFGPRIIKRLAHRLDGAREKVRRLREESSKWRQMALQVRAPEEILTVISGTSKDELTLSILEFLEAEKRPVNDGE